MARQNSLSQTFGSPMAPAFESQDSQAILEALKAELGVVATTDSGHERASREQTPYMVRHDCPLDLQVVPGVGELGNHSDVVSDNDRTPRSVTVEQLLRAQAPADEKTDTTQDTTLDEPIQLLDTQRISQNSPDELPDALVARPSVPTGMFAPPHKMGPSQGTPTQANEDRDYRNFGESSPAGAAKDTCEEDQSLQPEDTGAVNFGDLTQMARPSSQVSEDAGFETTKGDWRITERTPQQTSSIGHTPRRPRFIAPETPAPSRNPFASKPSIAAPLAGSQLFGQTQLSSAVKAASPTSSRPSPNMLNSASLNMMETSPLKDRANVSSPTDMRTSSPLRLHDIPDTGPDHKTDVLDETETPVNSRSSGADLIPQSPSMQPPKSSGVFQPSTHYEPMKKSQERKMVGAVPAHDLSSGSDSDDPVRQMERRKRVQKMRALAAEELGKVSFSRVTQRSSDEPPSRKKRRTLSADAMYQNSSPGADQPSSDLKEDGVSTKVRRTATASDDTAVDITTDITPRSKTVPTRRSQRKVLPRTRRQMDQVAGDDEIIPATSPIQSSSPAVHAKSTPDIAEPELPELVTEEVEPDQSGPGQGDALDSSLPVVRRRHPRTYDRSTRRSRRNPFLNSSTSEITSVAAEASVHTTPDPLQPSSSASTARGYDERRNVADTGNVKKDATTSHKIERDPATPDPSDAAEMSSDLTALSTTPTASSATTPGTQESAASARTELATVPSPAARTSLRKRVLRQAPRSASPQPTKRLSRSLRRSMRLDSESMDELQYSPVPKTADARVAQPHLNRSFRHSISTSNNGNRLFEGMVFAISFQSNQKQQERAKLESKITQAGGLILQDGFHELFEPCRILKSGSPVHDEHDVLKLTKMGCHGGFTALIADSHSRKPKYMQALALGLPCLAQQWITTCLSKGAIVGWEPYLLCAGSSAVLGHAIRSRNMAAFPVLQTSLTDMITLRPKFLTGQRILLVMDSRKSRNEAKEPYIFLAQALGPIMSRVFTVQHAREALQEAENTGKAFDWLYVDKGTATAESVLSIGVEGGGKKRRRSGAAVSMRNIRVLDDELLIQSLILGRMVEEDEVNF